MLLLPSFQLIKKFKKRNEGDIDMFILILASNVPGAPLSSALSWAAGRCLQLAAHPLAEWIQTESAESPGTCAKPLRGTF
jgi:hypothetical protein